MKFRVFNSIVGLISAICTFLFLTNEVLRTDKDGNDRLSSNTLTFQQNIPPTSRIISHFVGEDGPFFILPPPSALAVFMRFFLHYSFSKIGGFRTEFWTFDLLVFIRPRFQTLALCSHLQ